MVWQQRHDDDDDILRRQKRVLDDCWEVEAHPGGGDSDSTVEEPRGEEIGIMEKGVPISWPGTSNPLSSHQTSARQSGRVPSILGGGTKRLKFMPSHARAAFTSSTIKLGV